MHLKLLVYGFLAMSFALGSVQNLQNASISLVFPPKMFVFQLTQSILHRFTRSKMHQDLPVHSFVFIPCMPQVVKNSQNANCFCDFPLRRQ